MNAKSVYLNIINNLYDGVYVVDPKRKIVFWNKAAEDITGFKKEEIVGKFCQNNLLNHIDKDGKPLCILGCPLFATLEDGISREGEVFLRHKDGHRVPIMTRIMPIYEDNKIIGAIEIFTHSSPRVYEDDLVASLTDLAMNDQLTGLYNRRYIESFIEYKLSELKRFDTKFCVLFFDIDNFSYFNNTYGHEAGDAVLKSIAYSFKYNLRKSDIIGRWGGEEFIGVFEIKHDSQVLTVAEKIRVLVQNSEVKHGDKSLSVTVSIGATLARKDDTVESVIKRADELMYESKAKNKNCVTSDVVLSDEDAAQSAALSAKIAEGAHDNAVHPEAEGSETKKYMTRNNP